MDLIWKSYRRSFESMFSLKILVLLLIPPVLSVFLWLLLFFSLWGSLVISMEDITKTVFFFDFWQSFVPNLEFLSVLFHWIAIVLMVLLALPMVYLTSLLFTSILVIPYIALWVGKKKYPHLEKKHGGSLWGSFWNSLTASLVFLFWFLLTLPLWLIPGLQIIIPILLMSQLNRKVFFYDSLQDFASREEREILYKQQASSMFVLGMMNGVLTYVPFLFLLSPFITTLSFLHYSLDSLEKLRTSNFRFSRNEDVR
ncbi:MAG TPA: EI24 domain-containing protein [Pseudobdellovibrionaceae bacterium]|nr:EI24 domain-containing protein [Pseudobdellovibrionaceae bacterium]